MKIKFSLNTALALLSVSTFIHQASIVAATRTWDGGGTNNYWMTAINWVGDLAPTAGDELVFPPGALRLANSNNFPVGTVFNAITFAGSGYTLRGSILVLAGGIGGLHGAGINQVQVPVQLNASQTFTNNLGGSIYFISQTNDLNGHDLTFGTSGEIQTSSSLIVGDGAVIKTGAGNLIVGNANSYTGATEVRQGTLLVQSGAGLGLTNGNTTVFAGATLNPNGTFTSPEPLVLHGTFRIGGSAFGTNTWTGPVALMATNVIVQAQGNARADLDGPVYGSGGLTQNGIGTLALNGTNTYTGSTTNILGNLLINGYQPQSPIVFTGGTVAGTGVAGTITASGASAKTLAPGGSPGILTCSNLALSGTTTFRVELNGSSPGSGYDQLNVLGSVSLGTCTLSNSLGYTPVPGDSFTIINNDSSDPVVGTFNGRAEGALFSVAGLPFRITYTGGDGNDVVLTRIGSAVRFDGITRLGDDQIQLHATGGLSGVSYAIEAATNLNPVIQWSNLGSATASGAGVISFTDTNAPLFPMRFYHALSP